MKKLFVEIHAELDELDTLIKLFQKNTLRAKGILLPFDFSSQVGRRLDDIFMEDENDQ